MKLFRVVLLGVASCMPLGAQTVGPLSDIQAPSNSEATRGARVKEIGTAWWIRNRGLLAEESLRVAGHFSVARPVKDFAERGDVVWEVRVVHLSGGPTGVLWINEKTSKVL